MATTLFLVRKDQLSRTEIRERPDIALADGQVRVAIARFALTSNNITYAAFGDAMNYWAFYPTASRWYKHGVSSRPALWTPRGPGCGWSSTVVQPQ